METIGLRELNQNPSRAVARVRAGESLIVTDRGRPVLRMVPEIEQSTTLERLMNTGEVTPPAETGIPDLVPEIAADTESLADLIVAERDRERHR